MRRDRPDLDNLYEFKHKKKPSRLRGAVVGRKRTIILVALCLVLLIISFLIVWRVKRAVEPVYKPTEEAFAGITEEPVEELGGPAQYIKTPTTVEITENVYYDGGKIIIAKELLEKEDIREVDYDNELRYEFILRFRDRLNSIESIDDDVIEDITLTQEGVTVMTQRISAFNISEDDSFFYIEHISPKDKYAAVVFLDPGHGDVDFGATVDGVNEKDLNLDLAMRVYRMYLAGLDGSNDVKIYMTRQDDSWLTPEDRVLTADGIGDFFVSVHHNVYEYGSGPYGTETYYQDREEADGGVDGLTSGAVAAVLQRNVVEQLDSRDRGAIYNGTYYILNHATIPTALLEVGFMTNPEELALLLDDEYIDRAAVGVYNAIMEICGEWSFR